MRPHNSHRLSARLFIVCAASVLMALWFAGETARMDSFQNTIAAGTRPKAVAVNPVID